MIWLFLTLFSAVFLGIYEVIKKHALKDNAVWLVLLYSTFSSSVVFLPLIILSASGAIEAGSYLYVPIISLQEHLLILTKTLIVLTSWVFSYFSLKNLPITIASPIRATAPVWTLMGALVIYSERLSVVQWIGLVITLFFFFMFSTAGRKEGISFRHNKWVWFAVMGTLFASASALFDKFLIQTIDRMAVQAFFSVYQIVLLLPVVFVIRKTMANPLPLIWRWSIPLIGLFLVIADYLYFFALDFPEALISVVSTLRRGSVVVAFFFGAMLFHEVNIGRKGILLAGILIGIIILMMG
ncbi:DMT family transporter [Alkalitalea saponilacus]|uniref:Transporter family protein n=1 Tax=Alkalitalea saponilacus TaxID=889453 RepID=A0A1T5CZV8_9BACT|nr:DMT family transporter [Alkalitalea saponilacus]SKB64861.1 transporter family protein [Alkalitalea saponilacus]